MKLTPAVTTERTWHGPDSNGDVTGSIQMSSSGLPSHVTSVNVDLEGLARKAGGYHIHILPLNSQEPGSNVCGTTEGHYNPLGRHCKTHHCICQYVLSVSKML